MTDSPVVLITGGGAGIGAATARRLLAQGRRVTITGRRAERLAEFAATADAPERLLTVPGDAAEPAAVEEAVRLTVERFGRLDAVVANAGFSTAGTVADGDPRQWRDMVLANVLGPALLVRIALPHLRAVRGRIVLIGSVAGFVPTPGNLYGATKYAITGLAENIRRQVAEDGVGVTLIAPGRVETDFWEPYGGVPEGHHLTPDQVADAIVWALDAPAGVDVNTLVIRPLGQNV